MSDQGPDSPTEGGGAPTVLGLLGDRYEVRRQIARGGMADVYLAYDRQLSRDVAIKVLFPEFSRDDSFVRRFRREAQSVANLTHPNIVGIYDWGEQDETYYIVMEYVEGRSLSDILRQEGNLHPDRAADVAADIAAALAFAHRSGVIHRDVKSANVLVTDGGQVKVADFGIAQLAGVPEVDMTQVDSVVGTAAYLSPEQAQGFPLDPRSDLYSLGCVLFEMLTSRPPFTGDTPMAIAYRQVQEPAVAPSTLAEGVPASLDAICLKLLAKNPANRYPSADEVRADLRRYRAGQPVVAEPVAGPDDIAPVPGEQLVVLDESPRRVGILVFSLIVLFAVLAGLLALLVNNLSPSSSAASEAVPNVVGIEVGKARDTLASAGFVPITQFEENSQYPENTVFAQSPGAGSKHDVGSEVVLRVSFGNTVAVPEVVGRQSTVAAAQLEALGFKVKEVDTYHPVAALGEVIKQDPPANKEIATGSTVTITVSKGPQPVNIPELKGKTQAEATNVLSNLGFQVSIVEEPSPDVDQGKVLRTDPPAGQPLAPGNTVTVVVSTGKFAVVPSVVGMPAAQAIGVLKQAGFVPSLTTQLLPLGHPDDGKVLSQDPPPGQKLDAGSVVTIRVGTSSVPPTTQPPSTTTTSTTTSTTSTTIP
jgi:serine/threonine-protein kinase